MRKLIYTVPSSFLSIRVALGLLLIDLLLGVAGFVVIEGYSVLDAFYMTIITISTVGYTEVEPLTAVGKLFSSVYILLNIAVVAYILAVFSFYIVQGEIYKKMHINLIETNIAKLQNHIIICGYGKYGREIAVHFQKHHIPFVIIDNDPQKIELIQKSDEPFLYIEDDATHDEVLLRAGIKRAAALISALPDDSENLFTVLTARQLNPGINLISRAKDPKSQRKILLAGADHVVMPEQIGGFYMATLVSKPGAVEFFSFITNEYKSDIGFEEIRYAELPAHCQGKSIRELRIRHETGANIIGYKYPDGHYIVNPSPDAVLQPESSIIVLGNQEQLEALRKFFQREPKKR